MSLANVLLNSHNHVLGSAYIGDNLPDAESSGNGLNHENVFAFAYTVLEALFLVIQGNTNSQFKDIQEHSKLARDTQEMSNRMDEIIAELAKQDDKAAHTVPEDVQKYMTDHDIEVDNMSITDYINSKNPDQKVKPDPKTIPLNKGQLWAVKAALDNSASSTSDLVTQQQLIIQKSSQQMSAIITQLTGLLNKWGDICTQIAQKTYS